MKTIVKATIALVLMLSVECTADYDIKATNSPKKPNVGAFFSLNVSVNDEDGKPASNVPVSIAGWDGTEIQTRPCAGINQTAKGIFSIDVAVMNRRPHDIAKLAITVGDEPYVHSMLVSHRGPQVVDQSILSSMCGAFGMSGAASANAGGSGNWTSIGDNLVVAMLNTNMDAVAGSSAGFALDTSIAGASCSNAAGVQTTTGNTVFLPADGCVLPTLYVISKSSTLQIEAGISGTFGGNPARCGSASASSSMFCQSGKEPCRKEFMQDDTSDDFAERDGAYQTVSKDTVLKSSQIANSEFVAGNAACSSVMNLGEGGAVTFGQGKFTNFTQMTANIYSKPAAVEP